MGPFEREMIWMEAYIKAQAENLAIDIVGRWDIEDAWNYIKDRRQKEESPVSLA